MNKNFWIGVGAAFSLVLFGLGLLAIVLAQSNDPTFSARSTVFFAPVEAVNQIGAVVTSGLYVGEVELSNGVRCYVASNRSGTPAIDTLDQIVGLGCVRD